MDGDTLLATLPSLPRADEIWYYGAGCTPEAIPAMQHALAAKSGIGADSIHVASDMLGAARALCQQEEGIVAILGTGSNSCLYDGHDIVQNTPAMGFILGDEGSGAVLGRMLASDIYKGVLPSRIKVMFEEETGLTQAAIIDKVYRQPAPNRFLASLVPFIARHRSDMQELLHTAFSAFVERNLAPYRRPDLPVYFAGGVATEFEQELRHILSQKNIEFGGAEQSIIKKLARFHAKK